MKDKWFLFTIISSFIFLSFNMWLIIVNVFLLRNYEIQDASQINQALSSVIFSHLFFYGYATASSFFAVHPTFFFFSIEPFFSIFPNFVTSYAIQYTIVYFASIPLYLMAKRFFNDGKFAFLFSLAYLFYPGIFTSIALEEITMFIGLAIYTIYFYQIGRKAPFLISFILTLTTIEFAPFIGVFFFVYILIDKNMIKIKTSLHREIRLKQFAFSLYDFFLLSSIILSLSFVFIDNSTTLFFSGGTHPISINIGGTNFFSVSNLINGIQKDTFTKSLNMLFYNGPFLFLSVLDPIFLLQIPWFLVTLVSSNPIYYTPPLYYGAFIAAFVPLGFLYGLRRIYESVEPEKRRRLFRKVIVIVLVLNLVVLAQVGAVQYYESTSISTITSQDQGALLLSSLLKQGDTVTSGPNEMPVIGVFDWNDTFYGFTPTEYLMFRNQSPHSVYGFPLDLSNYGFYAAAGPFVMYKMNYSSSPVFNYYNYSDQEKLSQVSGFSFFSPPGNYTMSLGLSQVRYSQSIETGLDSGKNFSLPLGKAIAIPFRVDHTGILRAITTTSSYGGIYYISGMVTSSIGPTLYALTSVAYYPFQYFTFNNIVVKANTTYYFWYIPETWQVANYGSNSLPISTVNGTSYIGTVGYNGITNVSKLNFTIPITLLLESKAQGNIPVEIKVNGLTVNGTIGSRDRMSLSVNLATWQQVSVSISTNFTEYSSYYGSNISLSYYHHGNFQTYFFLDHPVLILLPLLIGGMIPITLTSKFNFKSSRKTVYRVSSNISLLTFVAFWTFFGLSWSLIPSLYNILVFKTIGIVLAFSFLVTMITYDWK
ncbi:MAG: DUF2079 domain-containing protein [Thermoplasmatales archaeon]|nr:DUF2079 domain-containing protein [Thermoplasmatales archaeon]